MKKNLLFVSALVLGLGANAQTVVYQASDATAFGSWTAVDADQDTHNWGIYDLTGAGTSFDAQAEVAGSKSWDSTDGALTPDNWLVSPAIDLTGSTGCTFTMGRAAFDVDFPAEKFSIYAVTAVDATAAITAFATATPLYTETIATGDEWLTVSADLSSLDNTANVFIAIRHYDCTDQNLFFVDDMTVQATGTNSLTENTISAKVYPNPANNVLNIEAKSEISSVSILTMDGKVVSTQEANGMTSVVNVAELTEGVYFYEIVAVDGSVLRKTFVKK